MKLRKIGNSLGTTFTRDILATAGFTEDVELDIVATPGEIRLHPPAGAAIRIEFTAQEAESLFRGNIDADFLAAARIKLREMEVRMQHDVRRKDIQRLANSHQNVVQAQVNLGRQLQGNKYEFTPELKSRFETLVVQEQEARAALNTALKGWTEPVYVQPIW